MAATVTADATATDEPSRFIDAGAAIAKGERLPVEGLDNPTTPPDVLQENALRRLHAGVFRRDAVVALALSGSPVSRTLLRFQLEGQGFKVVEADSIAAAGQAICSRLGKAVLVSLVVMDCFAHEPAESAVRHLRGFDAHINLVFLARPRPLDGKGFKVEPLNTMSPRDAYALGFDWVVPGVFDNTACAVLAEAFLTTSGRWTASAGRVAMATANHTRIRTLLADVTDRFFEGHAQIVAHEHARPRESVDKGTTATNAASRTPTATPSRVGTPAAAVPSPLVNFEPRNARETREDEAANAVFTAAITASRGRGVKSGQAAPPPLLPQSAATALATRTLASDPDVIDTNPVFVLLQAKYAAVQKELAERTNETGHKQLVLLDTERQLAELRVKHSELQSEHDTLQLTYQSVIQRDYVAERHDLLQKRATDKSRIKQLEDISKRMRARVDELEVAAGRNEGNRSLAQTQLRTLELEFDTYRKRTEKQAEGAEELIGRLKAKLKDGRELDSINERIRQAMEVRYLRRLAGQLKAHVVLLQTTVSKQERAAMEMLDHDANAPPPSHYQRRMSQSSYSGSLALGSAQPHSRRVSMYQQQQQQQQQQQSQLFALPQAVANDASLQPVPSPFAATVRKATRIRQLAPTRADGSVSAQPPSPLLGGGDAATPLPVLLSPPSALHHGGGVAPPPLLQLGADGRSVLLPPPAPVPGVVGVGHFAEMSLSISSSTTSAQRAALATAVSSAAAATAADIATGLAVAADPVSSTRVLTSPLRPSRRGTAAGNEVSWAAGEKVTSPTATVVPSAPSFPRNNTSSLTRFLSPAALATGSPTGMTRPLPQGSDGSLSPTSMALFGSGGIHDDPDVRDALACTAKVKRSLSTAFESPFLSTAGAMRALAPSHDSDADVDFLLGDRSAQPLPFGRPGKRTVGFAGAPSTAFGGGPLKGRAKSVAGATLSAPFQQPQPQPQQQPQAVAQPSAGRRATQSVACGQSPAPSAGLTPPASTASTALPPLVTNGSVSSMGPALSPTRRGTVAKSALAGSQPAATPAASGEEGADEQAPTAPGTPRRLSVQAAAVGGAKRPSHLVHSSSLVSVSNATSGTFDEAKGPRPKPPYGRDARRRESRAVTPPKEPTQLQAPSLLPRSVSPGGGYVNTIPPIVDNGITSLSTEFQQTQALTPQDQSDIDRTLADIVARFDSAVSLLSSHSEHLTGVVTRNASNEAGVLVAMAQAARTALAGHHNAASSARMAELKKQISALSEAMDTVTMDSDYSLLQQQGSAPVALYVNLFDARARREADLAEMESLLGPAGASKREKLLSDIAAAERRAQEMGPRVLQNGDLPAYGELVHQVLSLRRQLMKWDVPPSPSEVAAAAANGGKSPGSIASLLGAMPVGSAGGGTPLASPRSKSGTSSSALPIASLPGYAADDTTASLEFVIARATLLAGQKSLLATSNGGVGSSTGNSSGSNGVTGSANNVGGGALSLQNDAALPQLVAEMRRRVASRVQEAVEATVASLRDEVTRLRRIADTIVGRGADARRFDEAVDLKFLQKFMSPDGYFALTPGAIHELYLTHHKQLFRLLKHLKDRTPLPHLKIVDTAMVEKQLSKDAGDGRPATHKENVPFQMAADTALVCRFCDYFEDETEGQRRLARQRFKAVVDAGSFATSSAQTDVVHVLSDAAHAKLVAQAQTASSGAGGAVGGGGGGGGGGGSALKRIVSSLTASRMPSRNASFHGVAVAGGAAPAQGLPGVDTDGSNAANAFLHLSSLSSEDLARRRGTVPRGITPQRTSARASPEADITLMIPRGSSPVVRTVPAPPVPEVADPRQSVRKAVVTYTGAVPPGAPAGVPPLPLAPGVLESASVDAGLYAGPRPATSSSIGVQPWLLFAGGASNGFGFGPPSASPNGVVVVGAPSPHTARAATSQGAAARPPPGPPVVLSARMLLPSTPPLGITHATTVAFTSRAGFAGRRKAAAAGLQQQRAAEVAARIASQRRVLDELLPGLGSQRTGTAGAVGSSQHAAAGAAPFAESDSGPQTPVRREAVLRAPSVEPARSLTKAPAGQAALLAGARSASDVLADTPEFVVQRSDSRDGEVLTLAVPMFVALPLPST